MIRREFITLLGAAVAWPLAARAQRSEQMRRIGVLMGDAEDDPEVKARLTAFREALDRLGWSEGRNVRIDYRFAANNPDQYQPLAKQLIRLQPDVLLAYTTPIAAALQQQSHVVPIVFANVSDPVGSGLVASLARPGGNLTGWRQSRRSAGAGADQIRNRPEPQNGEVARPRSTAVAFGARRRGDRMKRRKFILLLGRRLFRLQCQ
jgi:ABC-type uncharacterized transport system substrate-binding protein